MDVADKYLTIVVSDPGRWTLWAHVDPTDSQGEFLLYAIGVSIEPGVGVWVKPELIMLSGDRPPITPKPPFIELIPWRAVQAISCSDKRPDTTVGFRLRT